MSVHKKEIRCQFIILARKDEPTADYARHRITRKDEKKSGKRNPVSVHHSGKEIRCQFIILGKKSGVSSSFWEKKSGVSSSFLPEKMNRQRITRDTGLRGKMY